MKKLCFVLSIFLFTLISCDMFNVDVKDFFTPEPPQVSDGSTYTITFNANGGLGAMPPQTFIKDETKSLSANTFTKTGYTFAGWNTQSDGTGASYTDGQNFTVIANLTLHATWTANIYTLDFNLDGGSGIANQITVTYNEEIGTLPGDPTNAGEDFDGWAIDGTVITAATVWKYTENKTATALWDVTTYTVTFDAEGGSPVPESLSVVDGSKITAPTPPTRAKYTFEGWYANVSSGPEWDFASFTITNNTTLYAKWEERTEVWLNGTSASDGNGDIATPCNIFESARDALFDGGTIWVSGKVTLPSGNHTWEATGSAITIKRSGGDTSDKSDDFDGNFVLVKDGASLTLQNITLDGQGGVEVDTDGNGTIDITGEGNVDALGALVYVGKNGNLTITTGAILQNNDNTVAGLETAGAIYAIGSNPANSAVVTMSGGSIRYNSSLEDGGGITVKGGTNFTMSAGIIEHNTSNKDGGGVYATGANTVFTMKESSKINSNSAINGGGVFCYESTFDLENGTISNNIAQKGAGINLYRDVIFTMEEGTISNNTAVNIDEKEASGGGIYIATRSIFSISDGSITGNFAVNNDNASKADGAGVYLTDTGTIAISGSPEIKNNEAGTTVSKTDNNIYFSNTSTTSSNVTIVGNIDGSADSIGLSPKTVTDGHLLVQNTGNFAFAEDYFAMDDGVTVTHVDASGNLVAGAELIPAYFTVEYYNGDNLATTVDLDTIIEVPVLDPTTGLPTGLTVEKTVREHQKEERFLNYGEWKDPKLEFTQAQFEDFLVAVGAPVSTTVEEFVDIMVAANPSISVRKVNNNTLGLNLAVEYLEVANTAPFEGQIIFTHAVNPADMTTEVDMNYDGTSDGQLSTFATYPGATLNQNILTGSFSTKPELEAFIAKYTGYDGASNGSVINIFIDNYVHPITPPAGIFTFVDDGTGAGWHVKAGSDIDTVTDLVIPSTYGGLPVTGIADQAFIYKTAITSVVIPSSVTTIGSAAFYNCSGLTGDLVIPNSVTIIESSAFQSCSGLTSVVIPDSVTTIGDHAFYNCSGLTSVVIPNSVTTIGSNVFQSCSGLTSVVIPDSVTTIGDHAFQSCSGLTSVVIPNSVKTIGRYAFNGCSNLTSVIIPDNVTSIETQAFSNCQNLTSVVIPDSVTTIGYAAFLSCSGLTSVVIPDSVTTIGEIAFKNCSGLTSVVIPDSVTTIDSSAFRDCSSLNIVHTDRTKSSDGSSGGANPYPVYDAGPPESGWNTSNNDPLFDATWVLLTPTLSAPADFTVVNGKITKYNGSDENVVIPTRDKDNNLITSIGEGSFTNNTTIKSVVIPNGVESIDINAFWACSNLVSVTIPNSVTMIGSYAFSGCSALTVVITNQTNSGYPSGWDEDGNFYIFSSTWVAIP